MDPYQQLIEAMNLFPQNPLTYTAFAIIGAEAIIRLYIDPISRFVYLAWFVEWLPESFKQEIRAKQEYPEMLKDAKRHLFPAPSTPEPDPLIKPYIATLGPWMAFEFGLIMIGFSILIFGSLLAFSIGLVALALITIGFLRFVEWRMRKFSSDSKQAV